MGGEDLRKKDGFGRTEAYRETKDEDGFGKTEAYREKKDKERLRQNRS